MRDHLCKAGWTDCVLLGKNELTAGSTWDAAGNVPVFSSIWSIMNMLRYSAELYRGLGEAVDCLMNYNVTGSVRLGHTKKRLQEFQKVVGMGRSQGMDLNILTPAEIKAVYPFVETHDLTGALHASYDGDIDPAQLAQALAKGARQMGPDDLERLEWHIHDAMARVPLLASAGLSRVNNGGWPRRRWC